MDSLELKALGDQIHSAVADLRSKVDTEISEIKKGIKAAPADLDKVNAAIDALTEKSDAIAQKAEAAKAAAEALDLAIQRKGITGEAGETDKEVKLFNATLEGKGEVDGAGYGEYKAAFNAFLRQDQRMLGPDQVKAMSVGSDADGGYLVPADMAGRIVARMFETSPIRTIAGVQIISSDALEGVIDNDEAASGGWVSEGGTRAVTNTPTIGKWRIPVHEVFAQPEVTQKLLDDAAVDVESWLAMKVADKLTRVENDAFVNGNGVAKPRGFASYTTAATADASRAWGVPEHVKTGANGAFASSNPADVLFDLIGAFKDQYLQNARFVTRREVITAIRKFKESTTNAYIWQPGLQAGQPQTILGFPVTIAQDMPTLATDSLSLAFGDFREGYQIVDRIGFRTLRDPYTNKPFVRFYTTKRVGGDVLNFEAIKFLKFSA